MNRFPVEISELAKYIGFLTISNYQYACQYLLYINMIFVDLNTETAESHESHGSLSRSWQSIQILQLDRSLLELHVFPPRALSSSAALASFAMSNVSPLSA